MNSMEDLFEPLLKEAIDMIPQKYQAKMTHVAIVTADEPSVEQRRKLHLRQNDHLFGLYEGVPLPNRQGNVLSIAPDIITIFKHPMLELCSTPERLRKQIRETLWHEVAHYFGLDHLQIHQAAKKK